MTPVAERQQLATMTAAVLAAVAFGVLSGTQPVAAIVLAGLAGLMVLTVVAPVAHLTLLIILTAIVPYQLQNAVQGGGVGLVASDAVLLTGLARGAFVLAQRRLRASEVVGIALTLLFLAAAAFQFVHGIRRGAPLSNAGDELRTLLGLGVVLVALPILQDDEARARLLKALLGTGLLLGLWGIAQWSLDLPYFPGAGVREGVALTSSGRGQLQGGLYAFPVAVTLAFAALMWGGVRSALGRAALGACIALNAICILLTFERTFWLVTLVACAFVVLRTGREQRARAVALVPVVVVVSAVPLAFLAPDTLTTARERLLSLNQYASDSAVSYRVREAQETIEEIHLAPVAGSGLGASIWWGRPASEVPPSVNYFVHNGYLWTAWKLGIPIALLLWLPLFLAILRRGRVAAGRVVAGVATGAQASLLALAVTAVTFPSVASKTITTTMGLLLAFCLLPRRAARAADSAVSP
jgi:hypothetical protein